MAFNLLGKCVGVGPRDQGLYGTVGLSSGFFQDILGGVKKNLAAF